MFKTSGGQFGAANALSKIGQPAIPALMQVLTDPHEAVRSGALSALGGMGKVAKSALLNEGMNQAGTGTSPNFR